MAVVGIIYVPVGQMDKDAQVSDTLATSKSVIHTVYHTFPVQSNRQSSAFV